MQRDLFEGLNPDQRDAVGTMDGPLLILAGPGSGKTRVITHRIAYLVSVGGVDPGKIAAVTFTNKAAKEMRGRTIDLLRTQPGQQPTCGTFHALCAAILRRDGEEIGVKRDFVIYDQDDQLRLVKKSLEEAGLDPKQNKPRGILASISKAKGALLDPQEYARTAGSYYEEIVSRMYQRYTEFLKQSRALDFDDLLFKVVQLFEGFPATLQRYQNQYVHLLVDEFQDTNVVQYAIARMLAGKHDNICVVGDPDQSIYSWRNADIRNILSFKKDYPNAKVVSLEENYRSTKNILEAAKFIIAPNQHRHEKKLYTQKGHGAPLIVHEAHNVEEEAQWVVREIDRLVKENNYHLGDCAVMYRINAQSRALENAHFVYGVPYQLVGAQRFYNRREVKDIIAYLRLIINPYDEVSLERVINVPSRGIGGVTMEELSKAARGSGVPLYTALQDIVSRSENGGDVNTLSPRSIAALTRFLGILNGLIEESESQNVVNLIDTLIERIGYRRYIIEGDERGPEKWDNVMEVRHDAETFQDLSPKEGRTAYLEKVALTQDADNVDESTGAVTLTTLHQAKGLEFPVVFIVGMEENILPHSRSMDDPDQMEEERRLCYVGVTRAQERLYFTYAFTRSLMGNFAVQSIPSRFLRDIPVRVLKKSRNSATTIRRDWTKRDTVLDAQFLPDPVNAGDKVRHPAFGEGVVINAKRIDMDYEITVAFKDNVGIKRMLQSLAGLTNI